MSGISGTARNAYADKSTAEDLDKLGHDLGLNVRTDEKIQSGAFHADGFTAVRESKEAMVEVAKDATGLSSATAFAKDHAIDKGIEKAHEHIAVMLEERGSQFAKGARVVGGAAQIIGVLKMGGDLRHILNLANEGAEKGRNAFANDALAVGLTLSLKVPEGFVRAQIAIHPSQDTTSTHSGAMKVSARLDNTPELVAVLQTRFDNGFFVAHKAMDAVATLPADQREPAMQTLIKSMGGPDRDNDLAFGLGIQAAIYAANTGKLSAETAKVGDRMVARPHIPTRN